MLACQSALLILHHLTFTNKSSPRTPAARAVLWPSVSYTTHTHTHTLLLASDVACRMGNGEQQKASCRCKSGSLEKEPVGVFASVCADLKITPASKTGSAERVTSACTGSNSSPPRREMLMLGCVIGM